MEPESKSFLPRGLGKRSAHWTFTSISQAVEPIRNASSSESSRISSSELAASPIDTFPIRIQQRCIAPGGTPAVSFNVSANIQAPPLAEFFERLRIRIPGLGTGSLESHYTTRRPALRTTQFCRTPE